MKSAHAATARMVATDNLRVPEAYAARKRKVDDTFLHNSIRLTGIQQPLIVIRISDADYLVIDGIRRLRVAQSLKFAEVPCVIDHGIDDVDDEAEYRNRIRFILDEHRQDLMPSQRAALIRKLQESFDLTTKQVGLYLGVTAGTITNWTVVEKVIPEIQKAIDDGVINIHTARAFAAMTKKGQQAIWDEHATHVLKSSGDTLHRWVRKTFPPSEYHDYYVSPATVIKQLSRKKQGRKSPQRAVVSAAEKKSLLNDVDAKRIELEDKQLQVRDFDQHIQAAIPVIEQIRQNQELWESLPNVIRSDLERFAESYCQ